MAMNPSGKESAVDVDVHAVRSLMEDHWRAMLVVVRTDQEAAFRSVRDFDANVRRIGALMAEDQAAAFLAAVESERSRLVAEYNRDPEALKRRLGLSVPPVHKQATRVGMADMAVRTAVRATIWESIATAFWFLR